MKREEIIAALKRDKPLMLEKFGVEEIACLVRTRATNKSTIRILTCW